MLPRQSWSSSSTHLSWWPVGEDWITTSPSGRVLLGIMPVVMTWSMWNWHQWVMIHGDCCGWFLESISSVLLILVINTCNFTSRTSSKLKSTVPGLHICIRSFLFRGCNSNSRQIVLFCNNIVRHVATFPGLRWGRSSEQGPSLFGITRGPADGNHSGGMPSKMEFV